MIRVSIIFRQELLVSCQPAVSGLLSPGTIITNKLSGWVPAATHSVHFFRACINPLETLPQVFLGQCRQSCGYRDSSTCPVWCRWTGATPKWGQRCPHCQPCCPEPGLSRAWQLPETQYGMSGGETIMLCWHRSGCLEQVDGHSSSDCLPK